MSVNLRPLLATDTSAGNHGETAITLPDDLLIALADWTFLVGSGDDSLWLRNVGLTAVEWTRPDLRGAICGRKVILVTPDDGRSQRVARDIGTAIAQRGLSVLRVWVLAGLGSQAASLQAWCGRNDFSASLRRDKPWEPRPERPDMPATGESLPRTPPPRFSGDPRPIEVELVPVPRMDERLLPEALRGWIVDIAERGGFPLEYPAAAAVVGLSGLIGRRIALRPKRVDDWLVVPNLWGAVVGPPGVQKTPAVEEPLRPLHRLADRAWQNQLAEAAVFKKGRLVQEARHSAAMRALRKAARDKKPDEELDRLATDVQGDRDPLGTFSKRYLVHDTTVEKLGELLAENPNGLTLYRDELIGFLRSMDRQGHESDRGFYLEAWNGSNSFAYDRIGRGTIMIPNTCLAIFGTIQPGPLARYLRASASGEEADGFMPRFQVLVYPDPVAEFVNIDRKPDAQARAIAERVFDGLDRLDPIARGCPGDGERKVPFLGFDPQAQEFFDDWRIKLEVRLRSGQESTLLTCHLAKYRSLMPSLALVFHLIDSHAASTLEPVSLHSAQAAIAWCDLLEAHARRIYQSALDGDVDAATHLGERIKGKLSNPFTARAVARKGWSGLTTTEEVRRAAGILQDRGWLSSVEVPTDREKGGRPTEVYWIHPRLTVAH